MPNCGDVERTLEALHNAADEAAVARAVATAEQLPAALRGCASWNGLRAAVSQTRSIVDQTFTVRAGERLVIGVTRVEPVPVRTWGMVFATQALGEGGPAMVLRFLVIVVRCTMRNVGRKGTTT